MITWKEKIEFLGLEIKSREWNSGVIVTVRYPGGLSSGERYGDTEEEALGRAAISLPLDWNSVERRITERQWLQMARL